MLLRVFRLYYLSVKASFQRLRYDLAKEVVVIICALIIFATFLYVFNDFLNVEVKHLSEGMRLAFAQASAWAILAAATWAAIRNCRAERFENASFKRTALRLGEVPSGVLIYLWLRCLTTVGLCYGLAWYFIYRYLVAFDFLFAAFLQVSLLVAVFLVQMLPMRAKEKTEPSIRAPSNALAQRQIPAPWVMALWRLKQIVFRNRLTQVCLGAALIFALLDILLMINNAPVFALVFASLIVGVFSSISMAFQLQDDLNYAWAERSMGVSHNAFIDAYLKIAFILGSTFGLLLLIGFLVRTAVGTSLNLATVSDGLKLLAVTLIPNLIMPSIMLQIDGRKPAIQIILVILIGTFVATAVFANWLGLIVLVLAIYYGNTLQIGRFYRA